MYEYSPNFDKKFEKLLFGGLLMLSILFFIGSKMPSMPLPILFQWISFCLLAVALIGAGSVLGCRYVYCVEPREEDNSYDLVVYRVRAERRVAVCRVACASILSMTRVTKENRRALTRSHKGYRVYRYTDALCTENLYLLRLEEDCDSVVIYIFSDLGLKNAISNHR